MDMTRPLGRGGYLTNVVAILLVCGLLGTGIYWVCNVVIPERAAEARAAELAQEEAAAATAPKPNDKAAEPAAEANGEQAPAEETAAAETAPAETPPAASPPAAAPAEEHHNVFFEVSIYLFIVLGFFGLGVILTQCMRRLKTVGWPALTAVLLLIPGVNVLYLIALVLPGDSVKEH